ncbi:MAG: hypothetical protein KGL19_10205 [Bacteroidota bacterium]|nr:hypothetical protein [Bacteroidota bacterium]
MKKLLLLSAFASLSFFVKAQDFKKVQTASLLGQLEMAKTEIDKFESDTKALAKPEYWMWRAKIYAAVYKDEKLRAKYPAAEVAASDAFKKCVSMDTSMKSMKENNGYDAAFDIYTTSFNQGIKAFNSKKWDSSLYYFNYSVDYYDIIYKNKWSSLTMPFDTTSILYAGYSAQNAMKINEATKFYERLVDNHVAGEANLDIYRYILIASSDKKDSANFYKYYAICEKTYPKENWYEYELDFIRKFYDLAGKTAFYERENAAGTLTATKYLHFGDMFVNLSKEDKEGLDSAKILAYQIKGREAFKKAFTLDPSNSIAAFNAGVIHYNDFNTYDDKYRALTKALQEINTKKVVEKDPKKKAAQDAKFKLLTDPVKASRDSVEMQILESADSAVNWLEKAFTVLKEKHPKDRFEKSSYIKSIDFLANLYMYKRDKVRGKDAKAYDALDAKYKFYDNMHDTAENEK